jgi:hypothetical protein
MLIVKKSARDALLLSSLPRRSGRQRPDHRLLLLAWRDSAVIVTARTRITRMAP